jgi:hypothetical protein
LFKTRTKPAIIRENAVKEPHPAGDKMEQKSYKIVFGKERLITPGGLAIAGQILKHTNLRRRLNALGKPKDYKHGNYDCVIGYAGLLCQGKTEYEDMREMLEDPSYYCTALRINSIASAETVRQRLDYLGSELSTSDLLMEESANLLKTSGIQPTCTFTGHVALDVDVSIHDNSKTKKAGVSRTYLGIDGYAPIYAYLGEEGYICNTELREGKSHSQDGTEEFLEKSLHLAKRITSEKLLVRMDSGNDALDNIKICHKEGVDYIIKRNLRKESIIEWLKVARENGEAIEHREGKTVYTGSITRDRGLESPIRIVFRVTERTILANGQILLEAKIDVDTWWTSLENSPEDIFRLYREHATCEQFHSEIKSDIGLERFPSSHFNTNAAILKIAALAYNILRIIGQTALGVGKKLTRHDVRRLRAKTVMKRLIFIAVHVISHARQVFLSLGRSNLWRETFFKVYEAFA